jgi:G3E family GTPase
VLLNKIDLVSQSDLTHVEQLVQNINSEAPILHTKYAQVDLERILNINAYTDVKTRPRHSHYKADEKISTISFKLPVLSMSQRDDLEEWLRVLIWRETGGTYHIRRVKGIFQREDGIVEIIQGVGQIYEFKEVKTAVGQGILVIIGQGLQGLLADSNLESLLGRVDGL